jgi:Methyltransferase domain
MTWWALTYRQNSSTSPAPNETNRISYVHADVCTTQWWDGDPFDGAVSSMALMDIDDLDGAVSTAATTVRPGG